MPTNFFGGSRMGKRKILSHEEAARSLLVLVDGDQWHGEEISIEKNLSGHGYWINTTIHHKDRGVRQRYKVEYSGLVTSWFGLKSGKMLFSHLEVFMNDGEWTAEELSTFEDAKKRTWIQLDISNAESETQYSIAIEQQSMVDAFYALKDDIDDLAAIVKLAVTAVAKAL